MSTQQSGTPTLRVESPPPVVAYSVTSPISNTRRKEVLIRDSRRVDKPPAAPHVALLPVRYAVAPRAPGEGPARYAAPTLKHGLPAVARTCYVLRHLRAGMVYVFAQGKLHDFAVTAGGHLRPHGLEAGRGGILIESTALLFPQSWGEVHIAFSEHEWSPAQRRRAIADTDGARTGGMQRFSLVAPQDDAFALDRLGTEVEEYAGRAAQYAWSDHPGSARTVATYERLPELARGGVQGIALDDPIGITHDLTALIEHALKDLADYVRAPDEAGTERGGRPTEDSQGPAIPSLLPTAPEPPQALDARRARYRRKIIADTIGRLYENGYSAGTDPDTLARLRLEHWRAEPANRGKPEPTLAELRRDVVSGAGTNPRAARLLKHVDEPARRAFLREFDAEVARLHRKLSEHRQDRLAWLRTWALAARPDTLKAAWARFDMDDEQDWQHFELSFARAMAALGISPDGHAESVFDGEMALVGQWRATATEDSPLYRALFGYVPLRRRVAESAGAFGSSAEGMASAIEGIYRLFPANTGTDEIVRALTVYTLTRPHNWNGAVLDSVERVLERIAGCTAPKDLGAVLQGRYGTRVSASTITTTELATYLREAAGTAPPAHRWEGPARSGTLRADRQVVFEVIETRTTRHAPGPRPNPFKGWGSAGISAFAGMLYLFNLKRAAQAFDFDDAQTAADLGAAIFAVGGGINAGLIAYKGVAPVAFEASKRGLYTRLAWAARRDLVGRLMSAFTYKLFGYGGAFLGGATYGIQSHRLFQAGDTDAALWYAGAAVGAAAGGSALTYGGGALLAAGSTALLTPVGWIILGVVVLGGALFFVLAGDRDTDTPVDRWLDASSFGNHALPGTSGYASLDEELAALGAALYAAQLVDSDFSERIGFPHFQARATVRLPGFSFADSRLRATVNGNSLAPVERKQEGGDLLAQFSTYLRKDAGEREARFRIHYRPSPAFDRDLVLDFVVR